MEQVRLILAVILSILVFLIWDYLFIPDTPPKPATQQTSVEKSDIEPLPEEPQKEVPPPVKKPIPVREAEPPEMEVPLPEIIVETDLYSAKLSGPGACFTEFFLKNYKDSADSNAPNKRLISENNPIGTGCVDFVLPDAAENKTGIYTSQMDSGRIAVTKAPRTLSFYRQVNPSLTIEKRYTFYPDVYAIDLDVVLKNHSDDPITGDLGVTLNRSFSDKASRFVFEGPCTLKDGHLEEIKPDKIKDAPPITGELPWIAIQNRYFLTAVVTREKEAGTMVVARDDDGLVTAQYRPEFNGIPPNSMAVYHFKIYMGPKDIDILKTAGNDLDKAVNFGWFDFIARPCLWLMKHIYRIIPNYGVSIILVTLIIKLLFWPLGTKSYKSMGEMKRIQPLMAEIREKYKNDKKKMNEEMMGLYKTYKVNPLGGCLPMLVQIPVFIAFYRMLYQAIELRHAPFLLWINDLSAPERLFSFDVTVPFMQPPTGIPVLTIIMGATMFLQQKMQPSPGDPAQAKMMLLMPIFLTVIFINFPSGLVLYFIVNNLFSIFQQQYVTRKNS